MISTIFFYLFSAILLSSACMVVAARNPVHSVLFLILCFLNAAALFVMAGAEFLAMVLVIVYVGAVAVLFLFVVMMLDVDFIALREGFQRYMPLGLIVGLILMAEVGLTVGGFEFAGVGHGDRATLMPPGSTDASALGNLIYTHYAYVFELSGLLLLIAMIGAIVLTLTERTPARRQDISRQHARSVPGTLTMVKAELGAGVTLPEPCEREIV